MSDKSFVLGIDVGTTSLKVAVVDRDQRVRAVATRANQLYSQHPGWAEADPRRWWDNLCALVPEVLSAAGVRSGDVAGVAASGMVPAVLLLDAVGQPLRAAILQNDARAELEIHQLQSAMAGFDFVARTGSTLSQQSVAPTLLWLSRHEPQVMEQCRYVLGSYDWISAALGATLHVERNWLLESGLWELDGSGPVREITDAAEIDPSLVPVMKYPAAAVGAVSRDAAAATGLTVGTPLLVGGADHVLSAVAAGLMRPGDWLVKLGGAGDILVVVDRILGDPRLYLDAHPEPGLWLPNGCMATSGSLIRWFDQLVAPADRTVLEAEAGAKEPGGLICLPYFLGEKSPLHDPALRGAFVGLHLGHSRGDLYRAILESVAYGFRHHVDVFRECGVTLGSARVTNGGSESRLWKQILADVLDVPLVPILDHPGASLGAGLAAAVGVGLLPGWSAVGAAVVSGEPIEPDPATCQRYGEAYEIFRQAGEVLTPVSHRLAARDERGLGVPS